MERSFDEEDVDAGECSYRVDLGDASSVEAARSLFDGLRARVARGRAERPKAEHGLFAECPEGMSDDVHGALFPALTDAFETVTVSSYPSYRVEAAKLVAEPALPEREAWERVSDAGESERSLVATVTGTTGDGLVVDVGVPGLLPEDQIDLLPVRDLRALVGLRLEVRVVRYDVPRRELVVSRRTILEARRDALARETMAKVKLGAVLRGTVRTILGYGAFVDLGGVTALVHVSDFGPYQGRRPADLLVIGREVVVEVTRYDAERRRIELTLREYPPR